MNVMKITGKSFLSALLLLIFSISSLAQKPTETTRKVGELLDIGNVDGAVEILDKAIFQKKDLLESYKMRSFLRMLQGELSNAVLDLNEAIKLDSSSTELYARRAEIKGFLRDETALDDYNSAIANGYKTYKVYTGRAMIKRNKGMLAEAEADYQTAYGLNPEAPNAVLGYASILEQNGKTDEAVRILQNYLDAFEQRNEGKQPIKTEVKAITQGKIIRDEKTDYGRKQTIISGKTVKTDGNAQELSISEIEDIGNTAGAYANLAGIQIRNKQFDAAFANIQKAIAINNSDGYPLGIRGQIYLQKGEYKKALDDFNKSIEFMPQVPFYYMDRGITHLFLGNIEKAQADFDKFIEMNPRGKNFVEKRIKETEQKIKEN